MSISKCLASLRLFINLCAITGYCFIGSTITFMQRNSSYDCMCYLIGKVIGEERPIMTMLVATLVVLMMGGRECAIAPPGWWENWTIFWYWNWTNKKWCLDNWQLSESTLLGCLLFICAPLLIHLHGMWTTHKAQCSLNQTLINW